MLGAAPVYLTDDEAAGRLALLCEQIGEPLGQGLAARRYALSGGRRALYGTVLYRRRPDRSVFCEPTAQAAVSA
jgi:hypothetical protein